MPAPSSPVQRRPAAGVARSREHGGNGAELVRHFAGNTRGHLPTDRDPIEKDARGIAAVLRSDVCQNRAKKCEVIHLHTVGSGKPAPILEFAGENIPDASGSLWPDDDDRLDVRDCCEVREEPILQIFAHIGAGAVQLHKDRAQSATRTSERGDVTTNTVESYFSVFKRGMRGVYQHCSEKHLHCYLAEFDFRHNNRAALGVNDGTRAEELTKGIVGKRLTYRRPREQDIPF